MSTAGGDVESVEAGLRPAIRPPILRSIAIAMSWRVCFEIEIAIKYDNDMMKEAPILEGLALLLARLAPCGPSSP